MNVAVRGPTFDQSAVRPATTQSCGAAGAVAGRGGPGSWDLGLQVPELCDALSIHLR